MVAPQTMQRQAKSAPVVAAALIEWISIETCSSVMFHRSG